MSKEKVKFQGSVEKCVYDGDTFKIYALNVDKTEHPDIKHNSYGNVSIMGNLPMLIEGVDYDVIANEEETKYGISYKVSNIRKIGSCKSEDTLVFLKEVLTEKQANTIYDSYPNFVDIVMNDRIGEVDLKRLYNIGKVKINDIAEKIKSNIHLFDYMKEFKGYLSMSVIKKLAYKYTSIEVLMDALRKDPYECLCDVSGIGFKTADGILLELEECNVIEFESDLKTSEQRCMSCVIFLLKENEKNGNTKDNIANLRKKCLDLTPECVCHFVDAIKSDKIYYNKNTMDIALASTYEMEFNIANEIKYGLSVNRKWDFNWEKYKNGDNFSLSDEQIELLHSVCDNNVTILSGAAGCGKSASTEMLIRMLKDNNKSFVFAAPTGKAAKVLSGFSDVEVKTIHRALGYNPKLGWCYNKWNKLDCDVLLLDEASMISVELMGKVIDAIDFNKTKLVMIGDPNQLPSIQAGNLLYDFLASNKIPTVKLTKIFRYGTGGILTAATDINKGKKYLTDNNSKVTTLGNDGGYTFIKSNDDTIVNEAIAIYEKLITVGVNGTVYEPKDIAFLTAYNKGDYGAITLNNKLQKIANKNYGGNKNIEFRNTVYYIDDIIMQCSNDYRAGIYEDFFVANGECGVIDSISDKYMTVNLDDNKIIYDIEKMPDISLSYSYSVHKSQGATVKVVILISPRSHIYMTTANLLYVGITRASDRCFHFGLPSTINIAIKKKESFNRNTFMIDMLKN